MRTILSKLHTSTRQSLATKTMLVRSTDVIVVSSDDESNGNMFGETAPPKNSVPRQISTPSHEPNKWWELLSQYDNEGKSHDTSSLVARGTKRKEPDFGETPAADTLSGDSSGGERKSKYFGAHRHQVALELDTDSVIVILSSDDEGGLSPSGAGFSREKNSPVQNVSPTPFNDTGPTGSVEASPVLKQSGEFQKPGIFQQSGLAQIDQNPSVEQIESHPQTQVIPQAQNPPQTQNGVQHLEQDQVIEDDSDDEIAVLSKEEAERVGNFKPTTFEQPPPQRPYSDMNLAYQSALANASFNQPVPLLQMHDPLLYSLDPHEAQQDRKAHEYFDSQQLPQLETHSQTLDAQLTRFDSLRDSYLRNMRDARSRIETLSLDDTDQRADLIREINSSLADAQAAMDRAKKIRRYKTILYYVLQHKQRNLHYARQQRPLHNYPTQQSSFFNYSVPQGTLPTSQVPIMSMPRMGVQTQNVYDDSVHLQELLKDVGNEEKIEGMALTPPELSVQLLDHQRRGLHWLLKRESLVQGSILADDMGLGKTVQTIALLIANPPKEEDADRKTTLIVGPVSLLRQWNAELRAKINMENKQKVAFYHGADKKKVNTYKKMLKFDVILVSYTTLASEFKLHYAQVLEEAMLSHGQNILPDANLGGRVYASPFFTPDANFYRVVLDEAQYIKNKVSQTSKATALLKAKHRLCLTGTPMQNSVDELFPILRFLRTRPYNDETKFKRDIAVPMRSNVVGDAHEDYSRNNSMRKLRAILLAIMLRRTKDSKVDGKPLMVLPKKTIKKVIITMDAEEAKEYKALEAGIQKKAERLLMSRHRNSHSNILTLLLRLRQMCIHEILVQVGELNAEEKKVGYGGVQNWKTMYALSKNIPEEVRNRIAEDLSKSDRIMPVDVEESDQSCTQLTCPMCFDVVEETSIVLLHPCGHMICDGCVDGFFEQEANDDGTVPCTICRLNISENSLISYKIYDQVVNEKLEFDDLKAQYGLGDATKTTTSEKINKVIHDNGGFTLSAKLQKTLDIVRDVVKGSDDEKIIIFSHFTGTFDLLARALQDSSIEFLRYDGSMNIDLKNTTIKQFYQGSERVLLISLKAGNVGLTLTCASHVIIMDPFWNPFVEDQAMDRAHRFGQQKPVSVYKLLVTDSVEDRIVNLQDRKKELVNSALDSTELKKSSALGRQELGYLFGLNTMGPVRT